MNKSMLLLLVSSIVSINISMLVLAFKVDNVDKALRGIVIIVGVPSMAEPNTMEDILLERFTYEEGE